MATCKLILDKRTRLKDGTHNLCVRIIDRENQLYLKITKLTEKQYKSIFNSKNLSEEAVEFRRKCNERLTQCEKIISEHKTFSPTEIREKFFNVNPIVSESRSVRITDLFESYISEKKHLSLKTIDHMKYSSRLLTKDSPEITIHDINADTLKKIENERLCKGVKISSINSNMRDLRTIINFAIKTRRVEINKYVNPFGYNGYCIVECTPKKDVISNDELRSLISYNNFSTKDEEYARDIWELLYRLNGINFADLLRLRWDQRRGNTFVFTRKKTENTRKNHKREISAPIDERIEKLLLKIGDKDSLFVLGKLKVGYTETTFKNLNTKTRKSLNSKLKKISERLNLSVLLQLKTARDTYATVLRRSNNVSIDNISEMLGHSSTKVTKHYLDSMDFESQAEINKHLI